MTQKGPIYNNSEPKKPHKVYIKQNMKQQIQAATNLQAESLQLTHYLNDWIIEDTNKRFSKIRSTLISSKRYGVDDTIDKKLQRDKEEKMERTVEIKLGGSKERERAQVCRIQFPIIQERSKSSKDLMLPLIRPRNVTNYGQSRTRMVIARSEQKIKTPLSSVFQSALTSTNVAQKHNKDLLKKMKRKRKRSPNNNDGYGNKNGENRFEKQRIQFDVSEIKALLIRELKHSRNSAKKDLQPHAHVQH